LVLGHHDLCCSVEGEGPPVVAEALPHTEDRRDGRGRQGRYLRKGGDELFVLPQHADHLGLLKHHLGYENAVGIVRPAPGQVTSMRAVVVENGRSKSREHRCGYVGRVGGQRATKVRGIQSYSFVSLAEAHECPGAAMEEADLNCDTHPYVDRTARGRAGEQVAASYLSGRGYSVLARNQRTPAGELDLICRQSSQVVIVEVKARCSEEYGAGLEAIGPRKARRLRAAAVWWLSERGLLPCAIRFDAVIVLMDGQGLPRSLEHVKDVIGGGA
jgi:putative endonuclease